MHSYTHPENNHTHTDTNRAPCLQRRTGAQTGPEDTLLGAGRPARVQSCSPRIPGCAGKQIHQQGEALPHSGNVRTRGPGEAAGSPEAHRHQLLRLRHHPRPSDALPLPRPSEKCACSSQLAAPSPQASVTSTQKDDVPVASQQKAQEQRGKKAACAGSSALNALGSLGARQGPFETAGATARGCRLISTRTALDGLHPPQPPGPAAPGCLSLGCGELRGAGQVSETHLLPGVPPLV